MKTKIVMLNLIAVFALCAICANPALAADANKTLRFAWEQDAEDLTVITKWHLLWGDTAGGPYVKATNINYDGGASGTYQADHPLTVNGTPGSTVTKYFVLRACIDDSNCSEDSNKTSYDFKIPIGAPFSFTVEVVTN